jgi:hypothetical protein
MRQKRWQLVSDDHVWFYPPDISLSTVELVSFAYQDTPYETCVFYANGDSEVLKRYKTQEDAVLGHIEYERKFNLKRISKSEFKV